MTNLTRISIILSSIKLFGAFMGILRTRLLIQFFGANLITDAFVMAWTIPSTFINLFMGTIYLTIIPVLTQSFYKSRKEGMSFFWSFFNGVSLLSSFLWLVLLIIGPFILQKLFIYKSPEQFELTKNYFYWLAPIIVFQLLSSGLSGLYAIRKKFIFPSLIQLIPLAFGIIGLFFYKAISLYGLILGMLIGNVITFISSLIFFKKNYSPLHFQFNASWNWFKRHGNTFLFMLGIQIAIQSIFIVDKIMASVLNEGQLSILHYSMRLNEMIFQGFILTLIITTYPLISKFILDNDQKQLTNMLIIVFKKIIYFAVPITVIIILAIDDGINFLFKSKHFSFSETSLMADVLTIYSIGLVFAGFNAVFFRVFIAKRMFLYLLSMGVVHLLIKILFNYLWLDQEIIGFSLSSITSLIIWFLMAVTLLRIKQIFIFQIKHIKIFIIPLIIGSISYLIGSLFLNYLSEEQYLLRFLMAVVTTIVFYLGGMFLTARKDIIEILNH